MRVRALAQRLARLLGDVDAFEFDRPLGGFDDAHQRLAGRRLAAARFAHESEGLALHDLEAHAGDRADRVTVDVEGDLEVLDLEEWRALVAHGSVASEFTGRGFQQAKAWPGSIEGWSSGRSVWHWSVAYLQRGAKLQPGERFKRFGGRPGIVTSRVWLVLETLGELSSSARV